MRRRPGEMSRASTDRSLLRFSSGVRICGRLLGGGEFSLACASREQYLLEEQPHWGRSPRAHAVLSACVTPADVIAYVNAASRVAVINKLRIQSLRY